DSGVEQGVSRLVAKVLVEAVVMEGVDHPPRPLREEEGAPGRELRVVEGQEVGERLAVSEDVDLDRGLIRRYVQAEGRPQVALQSLGAGDGLAVGGDRVVGVDGERPGPGLVAGRDERLAWVSPQRRAAEEPDRDEQVRPGPPAADQRAGSGPAGRLGSW